MQITKLKDRDLECDECPNYATHQVDDDLPGGKIDRKFYCDHHLPTKNLAPPSFKADLMSDYRRASRGY